MDKRLRDYLEDLISQKKDVNEAKRQAFADIETYMNEVQKRKEVNNAATALRDAAMAYRKACKNAGISPRVYDLVNEKEIYNDCNSVSTKTYLNPEGSYRTYTTSTSNNITASNSSDSIIQAFVRRW